MEKKRVFRVCCTAMLMALSKTAAAQDRATIVHHNSGTLVAFKTADIDSISFDSTDNVPDSLFYDATWTVNYDSLFVNDGFLNAQGNVGHLNENWTFTDFIPLQRATSIEVFACMKNIAGGGICFYDADGLFITSVYNIDGGKQYDPDNYAYTVEKADIPQGARLMRVQSGTRQAGKARVTYRNSDEHNGHQADERSPTKVSAVIDGHEEIGLPLNYIRRNTQLSATCRFDHFRKIRLWRGRNTYGAYSVEIDQDSVWVKSYYGVEQTTNRLKHGLSIAKDLSVIVDYGDQRALLTVMSGQQVFTSNVSWWGGGESYLTNEGDDPMFATLSFTAKDIYQPVWFIADSYFNWSYGMRWPYYMMQQGYTKWMADHKPGEASHEAVACFDYDINLAQPQYAVWCIGMNDASDTDDGPNPVWLDGVQHFIEVCQEKGVTPILTTTPNVPTRNHRKKNEWVRSRGCQYVDLASAVGSDDNDNWTDGMLSTDGIHPSATGAQALAEQMLKDFPQIKTLCK